MWGFARIFVLIWHRTIFRCCGQKWTVGLAASPPATGFWKHVFVIKGKINSFLSLAALKGALRSRVFFVHIIQVCISRWLKKYTKKYKLFWFRPNIYVIFAKILVDVWGLCQTVIINFDLGKNINFPFAYIQYIKIKRSIEIYVFSTFSLLKTCLVEAHAGTNCMRIRLVREQF